MQLLGKRVDSYGTLTPFKKVL